MRKILIVGATSAIAEATARIWAQRGDQLFLVGRDAARLEAIADDLRTRGGPLVATHMMDANDLGAHEAMLAAAERGLGGLDTALIAHGTLSDQPTCERSVDLALREISTNGLSVVALLTRLANLFEARPGACIAVISSVAGDRGRRSNYVYGSAKALVSAFASGMRQRLHPAGVSVITIKPGFVDTPMTRAFPKGPLWASPARVARGIDRAIARGSGVVYAPLFWRGIMAVIRAIPETVFRRLDL